jgi:hypothetical protein
LSEGAEENVKIIGISAKIETGFLLNTSQKKYNY